MCVWLNSYTMKVYLKNYPQSSTDNQAICLMKDHRYRKMKSRLLKVGYVPATSARLPRLLFCFLMQPLTVLMKQTRQAGCTIKQSILLRCLYERSSLHLHIKGVPWPGQLIPWKVPSAFSQAWVMEVADTAAWKAFLPRIVFPVELFPLPVLPRSTIRVISGQTRS